jgi:hypothetical protein
MKTKRSDFTLQFACFDCRKVFKQNYWRYMEVLKCPDCSRPMAWLGRAFRAPRRGNTKQWRKVELLARNGFTFWSHVGRRPKNLGEARTFVERNRKTTKGEKLANRIRNERGN